MDSDVKKLDKVTKSPIKKIYHPKGDIYHALKSTDDSFFGFGEAYFTAIHKGEVKGWKKHNQMVMNLVVPIGDVCFYFYDESISNTTFFIAGQCNYVRLTVQPGIWMAFEGVGEGTNLVLNIGNIPHDPDESLNALIDAFPILKVKKI
jgi:dTDP-4-dehydrorhamnose 3,5-epimerase